MKEKVTTDTSNNALGVRLVIALAVTFLAMKIHAEVTLTFASTPFGNNQQSDGSAIDNTFTFQLGTFANGFNPTSSNTSDWALDWRPVTDAGGTALSEATTQYGTLTTVFGTTEGFSSTVTLNHNNAPFDTTAQGYIWGFNSGGEWILLTNSDWTFGDATSEELSFTDIWDVADANQAIVGDLQFFDGDDFISIRTEDINAPKVPEPSAALVLACAGLLFGMRRRRPRT